MALKYRCPVYCYGRCSHVYLVWHIWNIFYVLMKDILGDNIMNQRDVNLNCGGRKGPTHEFKEPFCSMFFVHYLKSLKNPSWALHRNILVCYLFGRSYGMDNSIVRQIILIEISVRRQHKSVIYLHQTLPIFWWCVLRCGFENKHQKGTLLKSLDQHKKTKNT